MKITRRWADLMPPILVAAGLMLAGSGAIAGKFLLPVDCELGEDCFIQSYPDMAPGEAVADPFCGQASYDTHKGLDIRLRSLVDMEKGVAVVAAHDGQVLRIRDGEPDRLADTPQRQAEVAGKECGNGVVIAHPEGREVQYCHMKQGSIIVNPGDKVTAGQKIGEVGSSGMSEIPHLHMSVRSGNDELDPVTGRTLSKGCQEGKADPESSLFSPDLLPFMAGQSDLLGFGLADQPPDYDRLVVDGAPATAKPGGAVTVGWAWFINLREGDRIRIRVERPDGSVLVDSIEEQPLPRSKAAYSYFAGTREEPLPGEYLVRAELIRGGEAVLEKTRMVRVGE